MHLLLLLISLNCMAIPVLHNFKPHFNFTQIVSQDTCSTYSKRRDSVGCNPALFHENSKEGLTFFVGSKSDGESVDTGKKLLFESIKKEFLTELFEQRNFNSWGAGSYLEFNTPYFYLSFDPIQVNADIFVFNPAFPEVSMSLNQVKRLSLTSGTRLQSISSKNHTFDFGATVFYFEQKYYQDSFSLFELTNSSADELVQFKTEKSIAADISVLYRSNYQVIPNIGLMIKNLNSHYTIKEEDIISEKILQPLLIYEQYSKINIGYDFYFKFGSLNLETTIPFNKVYEELLNEYIASSLSYSLGGFSTTVSHSKYIDSFGFKFESNSSGIGIYYSTVQSLGDFSNKKESTAGFAFEVYL